MAKKTVSDTKRETQKEKSSKKKGSLLDGIFKAGGVVIPPINELNERDNLFFIDTGSLVLNALVSGTLFGGVPSDCVSALAGETSTGKTFIALNVCKTFLDTYPEGEVVYFDTEHAVKQGMPADRGIDENRFRLSRVTTVEELRREVLNILDGYLEYSEEDRAKAKLLFVVDSLGNLSTQKEENEGKKDLDKQAKDMTRAQLIRSVFRTCNNRLGRANVPLLMTNHVSVVIGGQSKPGAPPKKRMSGGEGLYYAASTIAFLSRSVIYDEVIKKVTGIRLSVNLEKSRHTKDTLRGVVRLDHNMGMDRYYGLFELAYDLQFLKLEGMRYRFPALKGEPEGRIAYKKNILEKPEEYWTKETLEGLDEVVKKTFRYGQGSQAAPIMMAGDGDDDAPLLDAAEV